MSIAIVMPLAQQRGGAEMMLMRLLRANQCGPKVPYVLGFLEAGPMADELAALGYPISIFPAGHLRQAHRYAKTVYDLSQWLQREKAQVVLSWMEKAHFYVAPASRLAHIPACWFLHSKPGSHWMNRLVTRLPAEAVLCCGESVRQAQQKMRPDCPTRLAYIAVDLDKFDPAQLPTPAEAKVELGFSSQDTVVGMVARLQRWKGVHFFLKAAAIVAQKFPQTQFLVVGGTHWNEPDYLDQLKQQVQEDGLAAQVRFAGQQEDVPLWMQAMDIIIHASFDEPTGTVILEGMALGKPVVAAKTEGPMEFVTEGQDGLLAPPGDSDALAAAIVRLLENKEMRADLGAAAHVRAGQFGVDRLASDVARHLYEVCAK